MRTYSTTADSKTYTTTYPDEVCLAYNHNTLKIVSSDTSAFEYSVKVGTIDIKAASYNGKADIYISKLLQMHLNNVPTTRNRLVSVTVKRGGTTIFNTNLNVFFSNLSIGERLDDYGAFAANAGNEIERHLTWFANFPFRISYLGIDGGVVQERKDTGIATSLGTIASTAMYDRLLTPSMKSQVSRQYTLEIGTGSDSVFSSEFDYTFYQIGKQRTKIVCKRNDAKCGYYFRWIDRRGYWQQWLFNRNTSEIKATANKDTIEEVTTLNGIQFSMERVLNVEADRTIKCMACNLDAEEYTNVESIATSCYVDLFFGYDKNGNELWLPVNVVSASHVKNDSRTLNNLEMSFKFKETPQQL